MATIDTINIKIKDPKNTWVALDIIDGITIVAEGKTPEEVEELAKKTDKKYFLMYVNNSKDTYTV